MCACVPHVSLGPVNTKVGHLSHWNEQLQVVVITWVWEPDLGLPERQVL